MKTIEDIKDYCKEQIAIQDESIKKLMPFYGWNQSISDDLNRITSHKIALTDLLE